MLKKLLLLTTFLLVTLTSYSEVPKIAYLNVDRIMEQSLVGKNIKLQLDRENKSNIEKFKKINELIKNKEKKLISQKNILSAEDFQKELRNLRIEINNFQKDQLKARNELNKKRINATNKLVLELTPILENFAKENSINLVLQKKKYCYRKKRDGNYR